jgi:uncharacterized protein (DUF1800 family)
MAVKSDIEHLLRRTEFVARPERVAALLRKRSIARAVADILNVPSDPGTVTFTPGATEGAMATEYARFWLDRMVRSPKPMQERMALFWHGHFVSSMRKVNNAGAMRDQIDLFRRDGLTDLRRLAVAMSLQPAMLRYLDNDRNRATSPNQNFSRELLELFLLGVGNYTEADVEAASLAWTGHSLDRTTWSYVWRDNWHDGTPKQFLGNVINRRGDGTQHGPETIAVVFGGGVVPADAGNAANRGRPTAEVAAEHLSRKLWAEFAGTTPPPAVIEAMRETAIASRFALKAWLTTMLTRPEFYADDVKAGLVRSPIAATVASLATTRLGGSDVSLSTLDAAGQRPLFPPNVSGWRTNRAWLNAAAMTARAGLASSIAGKAMPGYYNGDGMIHLAGGPLTRTEVRDTYRHRPTELVQRVLDLMQVSVTPETRLALDQYAIDAPYWERQHLVRLVLLSPDLHMA